MKDKMDVVELLKLMPEGIARALVKKMHPAVREEFASIVNGLFDGEE